MSALKPPDLCPTCGAEQGRPGDSIGVMFGGGLAVLSAAKFDRQARDATGDAAWFDGLHYDHAANRWRVTLVVAGFGRYEASSELGIDDALSNAMQAAAGREEVLP